MSYFYPVACWVASLPGEYHPFPVMQEHKVTKVAVITNCASVCFRSDVTVELPLMLMHPKPQGDLSV